MEEQTVQTEVIEMTLEDKLAGELRVFDPVTAGLEKTKQSASALVVKDKDDIEGYKLVKSFRKKTIRKLIRKVSDERKKVKRFYLEAGRAIDARAKEVTDELLAAEQICLDKEKVVEDEIKRIEEEHKEKLKQRNFSLMKVGSSFDPEMVANLDDEEFQNMLKIETDRYNAEQEELEAERKRGVEAQRLLKVEQDKRAEAERKIKEEREEMVREREAIASERQKLEEQKAAVVHKEPLADTKDLSDIPSVGDEQSFAVGVGQLTDEYVQRICTTYPTLESAWNRIMELEHQLGLVVVINDPKENGASDVG